MDVHIKFIGLLFPLYGDVKNIGNPLFHIFTSSFLLYELSVNMFMVISYAAKVCKSISYWPFAAGCWLTG
jgi:hypothetical protein